MADDKKKRGAQDRAQISIMDSYEVKYLAEKFKVTQRRVKEIVTEVGSSRSQVERVLKKK